MLDSFQVNGSLPQGAATPWGAFFSADSTPALRGASDGFGETPALPIGDAPLLSLQSRASDIHAQNLAGVSHQKLPCPLGEIGSTLRHRMLGLEGTQERAELGLCEPDKQSFTPRMLQRRPSHSRHDLMISVSVQASAEASHIVACQILLAKLLLGRFRLRTTASSQTQDSEYSRIWRRRERGRIGQACQRC
jgi:hypothetical protein